MVSFKHSSIHYVKVLKLFDNVTEDYTIVLAFNTYKCECASKGSLILFRFKQVNIE